MVRGLVAGGVCLLGFSVLAVLTTATQAQMRMEPLGSSTRLDPARGAPPVILIESSGESGKDLALYGPGLSLIEGVLAKMLAQSDVANGTQPPDGTQPADGAQSGSGTKITDGNISIEKSGEGDLPNGLHGKMTTKIDFDRCPKPDGRIALTFISKSLITKKGGTGSANVTVTIDGILQFDDDARSDGLVTNTRVEHAATGSAGGSYVDVSWNRVGNTAVRDRKVNRMSSEATAADVAAADSIRSLAEAAADQIASGIEKAIEAGHCVTLTAETTPAKRSKVAPSTAFEILAKPRAKLDGQPAGGTVVAMLEGGSALDPAGSKVRADARFRYTAPAEANRKAAVRWLRAPSAVSASPRSISIRMRQPSSLRAAQMPITARATYATSANPL